jgi:outer membrane protein assembly factor BamD
MAICYYEQIVDEKRDLDPLVKSKEYFEILIEQFPNTDFALDSKFKLEFDYGYFSFKRNVFRKTLFKEKKMDSCN